MEMSLEYAHQTAESLARKGYSLRSETRPLKGDQSSVVQVKHRLTAAEQELILETVTHPDSGSTYFLEIVRYYGLRTHSLQLDSWKASDTQVEFRYLTNPATGSAVTFVLDLLHPSPSDVSGS